MPPVQVASSSNIKVMGVTCLLTQPIETVNSYSVELHALDVPAGMISPEQMLARRADAEVVIVPDGCLPFTASPVSTMSRLPS